MTDHAKAAYGFKVAYEDEWLIAADKPAGLVVIETPKKEERTLTRLINDYLDSRGVVTNAYPCHRIDKETSGLILYAKGKSIQKAMMDEFKRREVGKLYVAIVHGRLNRAEGELRGDLYNWKKRKNELAITRYRTISAMRDFSVLEVEPFTGRTNQIRRHLAGIGHPLVGESVYAFRKDYKLRFRRVALHARSLKFTHPVTKKRISLSTPLPQDMQNLWDGSNGRCKNILSCK